MRCRTKSSERRDLWARRTTADEAVALVLQDRETGRHETGQSRPRCRAFLYCLSRILCSRVHISSYHVSSTSTCTDVPAFRAEFAGEALAGGNATSVAEIRAFDVQSLLKMLQAQAGSALHRSLP